MEPIGNIGKISEEFDWLIPRFISLSMEPDTYEDSHTFSFAGESWYMSICPMGMTTHNKVGHIGLFLKKCRSSTSIDLEYAFSLRTLNGEKFQEKHCTYNFTNIFDKHGICNYITRQQIFKNKLELLPDDNLTIVCTMKYPKPAENDDETISIQRLKTRSLMTQEKSLLLASKKRPMCSTVVDSGKLNDRKCVMAKTEDKTITVRRSETTSLTTQEKSPLTTSRKCPKCSAVVDSEKLYDHKCLMARAEATEKLLDDFADILESAEHSDVTIRVKNKEFRLHKSILAARNPYFNSMFKTDMIEKTTGVVSIDDCEPDIFQSFIYFVYTGKMNTLSCDNVCAMYEVADKYQEDQLKAECLCYMKNEISVDSFVDFIVLALKHAEKELLEFAIDFFCRKVKEIVQNVKWQIFLQEYPIQANELLVKAVNYHVK